ncbi:MAG: hypothetical protein R3225_09255 [Halofilum sp. (in: g-proteobacteria)]|nr:hypothetical protein [Halofilum sp. (in: g-proteobacteria)]
MIDDAPPRRILLVAEGTLDRPMVNVLWMVGGITITLICGFAIVRSGLPTLPMIAALIALLVAVALVQGRFGGPREFRVEKPLGGGPLLVTGRFNDGEIRAREPLPLEQVVLEDDALAFEAREGDRTRRYHLRPPAFRRDSLEQLQRSIANLEDASEGDLHRRFGPGNSHGIKLYDAKSLILLRFTQKPAYTAIMWLTCGATVLGWLLVAALLGA